jgi:hypothetical protein
MSKPHQQFFIVVFVLFALAGLFSLPVQQASAQSISTPQPSRCISCHEDLYHFYDTGKHFCLCFSNATCTDCHQGDSEAVLAEQAHVGLIARPACNCAETCQQCHPDDYAEKVAKFAEIAGIQPTPCAQPTATPTPQAGGAALSSPFPPQASTGLSELVRWIGFGLSGAAAVGLFAISIYLYLKGNSSRELP